MFLVEQLLSIHINLAWRATHPCYWYINDRKIYGEQKVKNGCINIIYTSVLKDMNNGLNHYKVKFKS